jgi:hypothetical protein
MTVSTRLLIVALLSVPPAGPALASPCTDEISLLVARLDDDAKTTGSLSTSGKAVAASREGLGQTGGENRPVGTPGAPQSHDEVEAVRQAAEAGKGGDRVMQAMAELHEARALDREGNGADCLATVAHARRLLDEAR